MSLPPRIIANEARYIFQCKVIEITEITHSNDQSIDIYKGMRVSLHFEEEKTYDKKAELRKMEHVSWRWGTRANYGEPAAATSPGLKRR